jgi:hypothetical protein
MKGLGEGGGEGLPHTIDYTNGIHVLIHSHNIDAIIKKSIAKHSTADTTYA